MPRRFPHDAALATDFSLTQIGGVGRAALSPALLGRALDPPNPAKAHQR